MQQSNTNTVQPQSNNNNGLYIGNLDEHMTTERLYSFFFQYKLVNIHHPYDQHQKKSKSFAFLYFNSPEDARRALSEQNN